MVSLPRLRGPKPERNDFRLEGKLKSFILMANVLGRMMTLKINLKNSLKTPFGKNVHMILGKGREKRQNRYALELSNTRSGRVWPS